MYFCPECDYTFDVKKLVSDSSDKIENISSLKVALKKIKNNENLNNIKLDLSIENLEKDEDFIKQKKHIKTKLIEITNKNNNSIMKFKCLNCNFEKPINQTIRLYHLDLNKEDDNISSIEDNKIYANDPILPRTRDYLCKNINCLSHKDTKNKEAVYLKNDYNYKLKYICTICFTGWNLK